jgi:hypothetical protein
MSEEIDHLKERLDTELKINEDLKKMGRDLSDSNSDLFKMTHRDLTVNYIDHLKEFRQLLYDLRWLESESIDCSNKIIKGIDLKHWLSSLAQILTISDRIRTFRDRLGKELDNE